MGDELSVCGACVFPEDRTRPHNSCDREIGPYVEVHICSLSLWSKYGSGQFD